MSVQHNDEAVLFQAFSAGQRRKVFNPEEIETRSDCGYFVQLLFNQGACQKLKGFGTGLEQERLTSERNTAIFAVLSLSAR